MPRFKYVAKASPSELVRGEMQAETHDALAGLLSNDGLFPLEIHLVEDDTRRHRNLFKNRSARNSLLFFTRQLANMLEAGMTTFSAMQLMKTQTEDTLLKHIIEDLLMRLQDGHQLSEACTAWPKMFSGLYVNMLRAGETGGMLPLVLGHLADNLEKKDEVKNQVRAAMAYPVLMFGMGVVTLVLLLTFVVPNIVQMFADIGQTLPLPTRMLMSMSDFFTAHGVVVGTMIAALALVFKIKLANQTFRVKIDRLKLRIPFLGALIIQAEVAQFTQTLSALLSHAVPIDRALDVVVASCNNLVLQREFQLTADAVRRGERMGASLSNSTLLPRLLGQMIATAEFTNQLETALQRIAISSAKEVERRVTLFTKLIEPGMILILGVAIGFIVFAMMMPIFQMDFAVQ